MSFPIEFKTLVVKNFLSVGADPQTIDLGSGDLTIILGENLDVTGNNGTRNGAGKTTILQAISFVLYGKPLTKIKVGNLVNNVNEKGTAVSLELVRGPVSYRIERGLKPTFLRFYVDNSEIGKGEQDEAQGENRRTQEEIDRVLDGLTPLLFKYIVALNTFSEPFFTMSAAEQRAIVEELFGATQVSRRADALKKLISKTKEDIRVEEAKIKILSETNARIDVALMKARAMVTQWETAHATKMKSISQELAEIGGIDFDAAIATFDALDAYDANAKGLRQEKETVEREVAALDREIRATTADLTRVKTELAKLDPVAHTNRLKAEITRAQEEIGRHTEKITATEAQRLEAEQNADTQDAGTCNYCGHALTSPEHLEKVRKRWRGVITECAAQSNDLTARIAARQTDIDALMIEIAGLEEASSSRRTELEAESVTRETELEQLQGAQSQLRSSLATVNQHVAALGPRPSVAFKDKDEVYGLKQYFLSRKAELDLEGKQSNPHLMQVQQLETTLQPIDRLPLETAQDLLKHQDFLLKLLTSKESFIRKKIIEENLPFLNSAMNGYLAVLGLPHTVEFQPDLTVEITKMGKDFDFEQMSRGEQNRIVLASGWAFRDIWENLNTSMNLLVVDELLDFGMCDQGAEAGLSILNKMAYERGKNVFLISHKETLRSRVGSTIWVRRSNDFTRFEMDSGE